MAAEEDKCVSVAAGCFDDVCVTCGIGYHLPSGRCDHCDTHRDKTQEVIILKVKKMKLVRHESGVWMTKPDETAAMLLAKHIAKALEGKLTIPESTLGMEIAPLVNELLDAAAESWPGPKELPGTDAKTLPILKEDPTGD